MRKYIRHPADIPIDIESVDARQFATEKLKDISIGGLSFHSTLPCQLGAVLNIRISIVNPAFETFAKVMWCENQGDYFDVGVELMSEDDAFRARMVEQVCHIEHYKQQVLNEEGRRLSGKEAASEWIEKFAHEFPQFDEVEHS